MYYEILSVLLHTFTIAMGFALVAFIYPKYEEEPEIIEFEYLFIEELEELLDSNKDK